jgi:hypothetical protein
MSTHESAGDLFPCHTCACHSQGGEFSIYVGWLHARAAGVGWPKLGGKGGDRCQALQAPGAIFRPRRGRVGGKLPSLCNVASVRLVAKRVSLGKG